MGARISVVECLAVVAAGAQPGDFNHLMICGKLALSHQPVNFLIDPRISEFGGAFASPIRPDNGDNFAACNREIKTPDSLAVVTSDPGILHRN